MDLQLWFCEALRDATLYVSSFIELLFWLGVRGVPFNPWRTFDDNNTDDNTNDNDNNKQKHNDDDDDDADDDGDDDDEDALLLFVFFLREPRIFRQNTHAWKKLAMHRAPRKIKKELGKVTCMRIR